MNAVAVVVLGLSWSGVALADGRDDLLKVERFRGSVPGFPVTTTGDGEIRARIALPASCHAPAVLVRAFAPATGAAGAWFAADGF